MSAHQSGRMRLPAMSALDGDDVFISIVNAEAVSP